MAESTGARPDRPAVITHPPVLFVGALLTGAALDWLIPLPMLAPTAGRVPGIALVVVGLILALWCIGLFHRAGTNAPTHLAATALVTDGPYRFSRNPMYLAMTVLSIGVALWANSAWMLGLLIPTFVLLNIGVIGPEERYLEAKFGDAYRQYRGRVRRWL
jgi:protein-S-isoprenylcysteine O-methyltransferase Ste14